MIWHEFLTFVISFNRSSASLLDPYLHRKLSFVNALERQNSFWICDVVKFLVIRMTFLSHPLGEFIQPAQVSLIKRNFLLHFVKRLKPNGADLYKKEVRMLFIDMTLDDFLTFVIPFNHLSASLLDPYLHLKLSFVHALETQNSLWICDVVKFFVIRMTFSSRLFGETEAKWCRAI